jgi:hypothetical protein
LAANTADHLLHAHVDRLGEAQRDAREFDEDLAQVLQELGPVAGTSLLDRLEHEKRVGLIRAHRIEAELVGTGARNDPADVGNLHERRLQPGVDREGFVEIDRGQRLHADDHVALVHGRHEGLAELGIGIG